MSEVRDKWAAGATYEGFMGRWSRQLAPRFVSWLRIPGSVHWLDVNAICSHADPASVLGCDPAEPFINCARRHSSGLRSSFVVAGSGALPSRADNDGSVTSLLALNFFPDPEAAVHERRSLAGTQGAVSACVWDYGGKMEFLRSFWDAAAAVDSTARELDEGTRFPLCRPEALADLFRAGGLGDVRCEPIEIPTEFASFDDYWRPLLGGTGPAPSYVASLDADRRTTLARRLEQSLPRGTGGTIALTARAWAVRGTSK